MLGDLDPDQLAAVTSDGAPLCVLAGAGSGKTRVLARRIAHRAANGSLDPRHTLAVTFTSRAARELRSRLALLGDRDLPTTGTFHAVAYAQLRSWWAATGQREPALLDRKARLVGRLLPARFPMPIAALVGELDWAAARGIAPDRYADAARDAHRERRVAPARIAEVFQAYEDEKRHRRVVDFDDLLVACTQAMRTDADFAASQRWRFRHLFVDEFQDVNPIQYALLLAWLGDRSDLCVVGDPNQSIYRWNGAEGRYLTEFARLHPGATVIELCTNHRSNPTVVRTADAVLASGLDGRVGDAPPRAVARRAMNEVAPTITACADDEDEAVTIARAVRSARGPGAPWRRQAVLTRTNAHAAQIAEVLERSGIPARLRASGSLLDHAAVRDALRSAGRARVPLASWLADFDDELAGRAVDASAPGRSPDVSDDRLDALRALSDHAHALLDEQPEAPAGALPAWLTAQWRDDPWGAAHHDAVDVSSFHAAKGLEWPIVHLAGIEEGFVPSFQARRAGELAEEQRLLYVALTRAESQVHLTWARRRTLGSRIVERRPSRWLAAIQRCVDELAPGRRRADPEVVRGSLDAARTALDAAPPTTAASPGVATRVARDALGEWRTRTARAARVTEAVVLPDRCLDRIAAIRPTTLDALGAIDGVGAITAAHHGPTILELLARTVEPAEAHLEATP